MNKYLRPKPTSIIKCILSTILFLFLNLNSFTQTRVLNTALPVGSTAGSAQVSSSGAASYNIPIIVPPGTNGMQPNLSISYNSMVSDGLLGIGCNLSGISAISRMPTSFYHDRVVDGVNFNNNDLFALDGQRLIVTSGTYGANNSEYHTEIENFTKVVSHGIAGVGPMWFTATTKSGYTIEYGNTTDSRIEAQGRSDVLFWYINKISDTHGNYMTFKYHEDNVNGEAWIERIDYSGNSNTGLQPFASVNFYYQTRQDPYNTYIEGSKQSHSMILNDIKTNFGTDFVKEYSFIYTYNKGTKLSEVKEKDKNGIAFNSTLISWDTLNWNMQENIPISNDKRKIFHFGDFNGDGRTDYIVYEDKTSYTTSDAWDLYTSNTDGITFSKQNGGYLSSVFKSFDVVDFNVDGFDDLVMQELKPYYTYTPMIFNATGYIRGVEINTNNYADQKYRFGDFNGDGLPELFVLLTNSGYWQTYSYILYTNNTLSPNISLLNTGTLSNWVSNMDIYSEKRDVFLDFDGDGKTDIMLISQYGSNFYKLGNTYPSLSSPYPKINDDVAFGDFNGDNKTDWLSYDTNAAKWMLYYSTGTSVVSKDLSNLCRLPYKDLNVFYAGNVNGDNLSDLIIQGFGPNVPGYNVPTGYHFLINKGENGFGPMESLYPPTLPLIVSFEANIIQDFNGDGISDVFFNSNYNKLTRNYSFTSGNNNMQVNSVTDGLNAIAQFVYKPLTDNTVYTKGTGEQYPNFDYTGPIYVVSSKTESNGIGGNFVTNYSYAKAKMNRQGLGFLGFMETSETNESTGMSVIKNFELKNYLDPPKTIFYYTPALTKTLLKTTSGISISEETNTLSLSALPNNSLLIYESGKTFVDYLYGINKSFTQVMNTNGDITSTQTDITGEGGVSIINENFNSFGSPGKVTSRSYRTGQVDYIRIQEFVYKANGDIETIITDPGKIKSVTTSFQYNSFGNRTNTTVSASSLSSRSGTTDYDPKGRFALKQTNSLSHFVEATYDDKSGNILTSKDVNGLITSYGYDGFYRLNLTTLPNTNTVSVNLYWKDTGAPENALFYSLSQSSGSSPVKTYFDILGREIRQVHKGFDGSDIYTDKVYNTKGQLYKTSYPYFTSASPEWTIYDYDDYGRSRGVNAPTGNVAVTYSGKTVTTTNTSSNPQQESSKTMNSFGQLESATDAGGTISYTYYSSGLPWNITSPGNLVTHMEYDEYGRQNKLSEANIGDITYEYNAYGELVTQVKNGYTSSLTYDELGRLKTLTEAEGVTTYTYDTKPNGKGMLAGITAPGNVTEDYSYDVYGRLATKTERIDAINFTDTLQYDNYNRLYRLTYPSGFGITYNYNSNGYLSEITRTIGGASIWKAETMNALGQIERFKSGNGLYTNQSFNHGFVTGIQTGTIQNLQYGWDQTTGNLSWRKDANRNLTENFTYDNLDRLTDITGNTSAHFDFAGNGNITSGTFAGNYTYHPVKPHAVEEVSNPAGAIDPEPQNIVYASFDKVSEITEGLKTATFVYGADKERRKMVYTEGSSPLTRYYAHGNYEKETGAANRELHYINAGTGVVAIYEKISDQMYYVHKDHLGSINVITSQSGAIVEEMSFDAWGRRRNPTNWTYSGVPSTHFIDRGYTGHEHLDKFGAINMNGRIYDPVNGRFFSPDIFVQSPGFTQSYNRYSYCMNNPLKYIDPSGWYTGPYTDGELPVWAQDQRNYAEHNNPTRWMFNQTSMPNNAWIHYSAPYSPSNSEYKRFATETQYVTVVKSVKTEGKMIGYSQFEEGEVREVLLDDYYFVTEKITLNEYWKKFGQANSGGGTCPNCLNPATVGNNYFGLTYPGGDNPRNYAGNYTYSYVPKRLSEYPAIGHDRRYDNLGIAGAKGLFTDTRAIGADWRFVREELMIAANPFNDVITRIQAFALGEGLGLAALPKTIFKVMQLNGRGGVEIYTAYRISNVGVTNAPSTHAH